MTNPKKPQLLYCLTTASFMLLCYMVDGFIAALAALCVFLMIATLVAFLEP